MPSKKDQLISFLESANMDKIESWGYIRINGNGSLLNGYEVIMQILLECQEVKNG